MNTVEQWKPIVGYEGLYEVSNLGRVKSLNYNHTGVEKILKQANNKYGYLRVCLCRDGKHKMFYLHRLVATAFIPNPKGLPEVNHLDENKANNCSSNIEWCNRLYNNNYGHHNKRMTAALSKAVEASKFPDFSEIELRFSSTRDAGRNGYCQVSVAACCRGCYFREGNNKYKGLYWRYAV